MKSFRKLKLGQRTGFTIIEVLIVLAIAGLIMLVVFLAVPALQRNWRNTARKKDAGLLFAAVQECLSNNVNDFNRCNEVNELPIDTSKFSIYETAHFGAACTDWVISGCVQTPPNEDEPNWLNHLICNNGDSLSSTLDGKRYVVGYFIEVPGAPAVPPWVPEGYSGRCL